MNNFAAIFADYENLYFTLRKALPHSVSSVDSLSEMFRELRARLDTEQHRPIIQRAYADFNVNDIDDEAPRSLLLNGFEPVMALGSGHKNAADMRLCVDVMSTLYTRKDIETYVIAAGDRDFIPVLMHLIESGKRVIVVSFRDSLSGDLRTIVGQDAIWAAEYFISEQVHQQIEEHKRQQNLKAKEELIRAQQEREQAAELQSANGYSEPELPPMVVPEFYPVQVVEDDVMNGSIQILVSEYGHHREIYLKPVKFRLEREFPQLDQFEVRQLFKDMEDMGAIAINQRQNEDKTYSVIILNWNHPQVRRAYDPQQVVN